MISYSKKINITNELAATEMESRGKIRRDRTIPFAKERYSRTGYVPDSSSWPLCIFHNESKKKLAGDAKKKNIWHPSEKREL